jgi:acetyl esterase/lipase
MICTLVLAAAVTQAPTTEKNISYGPDKRNVIDLYLPATPGPRPVILWVHGGGWEAGDKDKGGPFVAATSRGYVVAAINYRFTKTAVFPAQIEDVKLAVRWLKTNAKKYDINAEKIGICGASAGGHLSALAGSSAGIKELEKLAKPGEPDSSVAAVIDIFGPTDILAMLKPDAPAAGVIQRLYGGDPLKSEDLKKVAVLSNPIEHLDPKDAPVLIIHGKEDALVPVSQSEIYAAALKKHGIEHDLIVIEKAGHDGRVFTPDVMKKANAFWDKHLLAKK